MHCQFLVKIRHSISYISIYKSIHNIIDTERSLIVTRYIRTIQIFSHNIIVI